VLGGQEKKQIPPLRYGMTTRKAKAKAKATAKATEEADSLRE
jgi:hypothetical protein